MADWIAGIALASTLTALAWIDFRSFILPDSLNLLLATCGLIRVFIVGSPDGIDAMLGALAAGSLFWLVRTVHFRLRQNEGLGLGDVKLVAAGGLWVGLNGLPVMLLVATISAFAFVGLQTLSGRKVGIRTAIPFGPFLCLGIAAAWVSCV